MQAILIMSPILVCAFLTGILLGWVLFVALPRMRRAEKAPVPDRGAMLLDGKSVEDTEVTRR